MSKRLRRLIRVLKCHLAACEARQASTDARLAVDACYLTGLASGLELAIADAEVELECAEACRKARAELEADWPSELQIRELPSEN